MPESYKSLTESSEEDVGNDIEYVRYAVEIERTIHKLHGKIAGCSDPQKVALSVMETVSQFYDADWCGIIHIDLDVGVWTMTQRTDRWHRILVKNMNYQIIAVDG